MKTYLRLALIFCLLLQSFVGAADAHQFHQASNQHQVIIDHDHEDVEPIDLTDSAKNKLDCQHCCHCHSSAHSVLPVAISHLGFSKFSPNISTYRFESLTSLPKSLYRPPIV